MVSDVGVIAERLPWPGPRPYDEEHWDSFYGRDSEITELLGRIQVQKLTVLLGASGTGKTSLIRAGVVPMLRQERYHPQGDHTVWPVLLLRRWGSKRSTSFEEGLFLQLDLAIKAVKEWGTRQRQESAELDASRLWADLEASRPGTSGKAPLLEVLEALARAQARRGSKDDPSKEEQAVKPGGGGGLILIFDQFEEQLRSLRTGSEALRLIEKLFQSPAPIRVLLSMRREYRYALRELEITVGGLSGRSLYLKALREQKVIELVEDASNKSNVSIDRDVAARIVSWLAPRNDAAAGEPVAEIVDDSGGMKADSQEDEGRPDLLNLQAVLLELCNFAVRREASRVSMVLLDEFIADFREDSGSRIYNESESGQMVLGGALERWIEAAIRTETSGNSNMAPSGGKNPSHAKWAEMEPEDLTLQVLRIAVRLAPRLSSADYKVSQEENTLFRQALGEEIARLGVKDPERHSKIRVVENGEDLAPTLSDLELDRETSPEAQLTLSGLARIKEWSPAHTGDKIVVCFKETLDRLADANILQRTTSGRRTYWELVHDQFGPSFTKWAERQRGTWNDCKSSLVVCSGLQPIAIPVREIGPPPGNEFYELKAISWQGCGVESSRPERVTLRNVRFIDCFLRGTIFDAIDFIGCSFENCDLKGGLFRDCSFRTTVFVGCDSNVAFVRGSIEGLEFSDCKLHQPALDDIKLVGEVRFTGGSSVIQGYFDVIIGHRSKQPPIFFDAKSRAAFCLTRQEPKELLRFDDPDLDIQNSPLKPEFIVRG